MLSGTIRPATGVWALGLAAAVAVFMLADVLLRAGWWQVFLLAPWVLLVLWAVYVAAFASHVRADADGVTVQNLLRRTRVPWAAVSEIRLRWQLDLILNDGSVVTAFGASPAGRPGRPGLRAAETTRRTPPAVAEAERLQDLLDAWRADHAGALGNSDRVVERQRSWDVMPLAALGVLIAWSVASVMIANGGSR